MRLDVEEDLEDFEHEVKLWTPLKHRSIVALLHSVIDKQNKRGYMVLCLHGRRALRLDRKRRGLGASGHGVRRGDGDPRLPQRAAVPPPKRIIHRDLKPENLLFKDKDAACRYVIDFGIAEELPKGVDTSPNVVGTTSYMSPEVLEGKGGIPSDMWSIGCIVYFMPSGTLPFNGRSEEDKEAAIMKGTYAMPDSRFKNVSSDAKDFINQLLKKDPKDRMTAEQAMNHPWITERTKRGACFRPRGDVVTQGVCRRGESVPAGGTASSRDASYGCGAPQAPQRLREHRYDVDRPCVDRGA